MNSKQRYRNIAIPPELASTVNHALAQAARPQPVVRKIRFRTVWRVAAMLVVGFLVLVNTGATIARAAEVFPVIASLARLVTASEYTRQANRDDLVSVRLPALAGTGNAALEQRINKEIKQKMDAAVAAAELRAREAREARIATGGDPEEVIPVYVDVDYELKYSGNGIVSFVVDKTETLASAYTEQLLYNLELATGRELKLRDLLGADYQSIADTEIRRQMEIRVKEEDAVYFDGDMAAEGFLGVTAEQKFFINQRGNVVVVFAKYEIAPGCMGIQEFEIPTPALAPPVISASLSDRLTFMQETL